MVLCGRSEELFVKWVKEMSSVNFKKHLQSGQEFLKAVEYAAKKYGIRALAF